MSDAAKELIADTPKPAKRKPRRKAKRKAAPKPVARTKKDIGAFDGITRLNCPTACQGTCVITQDGFCGHPRKGALQSTHMLNSGTVARYREAKKILEIADIEAGLDPIE